MAVQLVTRVDTASLNQALQAIRSVSASAAKKAPREAARGFLRRMIEVTPPSAPGRTGLAARRAGERRIDKDLGKIFVPVILRGRRAEEWPDLEAIYELIMAGRKGKGAPKLPQKYHVDARKFKVLRDSLYKRVGLLAAGWNAAAEGLGVARPAWIRRHGSRNGRFQVHYDDGGLLITLTNAVRYNASVDGYSRRVQYALEEQAAAMMRRLQFMIEHDLARGRR